MRSIASTSPVGLLGELVGAVAGADGDGQRIDAGLGHEAFRLVRVGQQLVVRQFAGGAVAVLGLALAALERTQAAEFAFDASRPAAWADSTTSFVTRRCNRSRRASCRPLASEPSIITLVKPLSMALWQVAGLLPWSWCMTIGIFGYSSAAASIRWRR